MSKKAIVILSSIGFVVVIGAILGACWGLPQYRVWQQKLEGEAEFAKAEQNRRVVIEEARAKKEAAKMLAEAEVERAKGTAEANKIVGESLKGHDEYLKWLWIDKLAEGTTREMIYVPTEAGMPILESGRFARSPETSKPAQ